MWGLVWLLSRAQSGKKERWGGRRGWLTGSFRLEGRSIPRGREEVCLCHCDVWLLCDYGGGRECVCLVNNVTLLQ